MIATGPIRSTVLFGQIIRGGLLASALSLFGCSYVGKIVGSQPDSMDPKDWANIQAALVTAKDSESWTREAAQAYARVTGICISVANYYERNGKYGDSSRLSIGLIGSVAAGVVAPALAAANAARSVIAIWSGIGGVSAGFLSSYDQSQFATKANIDIYNRIRQSMIPYKPPEIMTSQAMAQAYIGNLAKLYSECKLPVLSESTTQDQITAAIDAAKKATAAQTATEAASASAAAAASAASVSAKSAADSASAVKGQ